jgi:hypothetical protein
MNRTARSESSALSSHICMKHRTSYHDAANQKYELVCVGNKDNCSVSSNDVKRLEAILLLLHTLSVGKSAITDEGTVPSGSVNGVCSLSKDT